MDKMPTTGPLLLKYPPLKNLKERTKALNCLGLPPELLFSRTRMKLIRLSISSMIFFYYLQRTPYTTL